MSDSDISSSSAVSESKLLEVRRLLLTLAEQASQPVSGGGGAVDPTTPAAACPASPSTDNKPHCPYCGEPIQQGARKCRWCGEFLAHPSAKAGLPRPRKRSLLEWILALFSRKRVGRTEFRLIAVGQILPNPYQPRRVVDTKNRDFERLKQSIAHHGVMVPIMVRPHQGKYQLMVGQRRLLACRELGISSIPANVKEIEDSEVLEMALLENLHRIPLSSIERARAFARLLVEKPHLGEKTLEDQFGLDPRTLERDKKLLSLIPLLAEAVVLQLITDEQAFMLAKIKDSERQTAMLTEVICRNRALAATTDATQTLLDKSPHQST